MRKRTPALALVRFLAALGLLLLLLGLACGINPIPTPGAGCGGGGGDGAGRDAAGGGGMDGAVGFDAPARPDTGIIPADDGAAAPDVPGPAQDAPAPADAPTGPDTPAPDVLPDAALPDVPLPADAGDGANDVPSCPCLTDEDCAAPPDPCQASRCEDCLCRYEPLDDETPCEDGLFCTVGDECRDGVCLGGLPRDCDDGERAVHCLCDEEADDCCCGCSPVILCSPAMECDDDDPCTDDACLRFVSPPECTFTPRVPCACDPAGADGGAWDCDDDDPCTTDACVPDADGPYPGLCAHDEDPSCE